MTSQAMFSSLPDPVKAKPIATFMGNLASPSIGHHVERRLYKCENGYLVVSAADVPFSGPETYIFKSDSKGEVLSYSELPGSFRGALDHKRALENAGFEVKGSPSTSNIAIQVAIDTCEAQVLKLQESIKNLKGYLT